MILVTGGFVAKEGCLQEALRESLEHLRRSRTERGCLSYAVSQDIENPSRLVFVEHWTDPEALQAHFAVPASREFVKAIAALADGPLEMTVYAATQVKL